MEDIANTDYAHAKRVCKDVEIKNLGDYHDLYVQSDTLLLNDIFENFRNMRFETYELDLEKFLICWISSFKKDQSKIKYFN